MEKQMKPDMSEYILKTPQKPKPGFVQETISRSTIAYTFDGLGNEKTVDPKSYVAYARIDKINGRERHYVKVAKIGAMAGRLPNPKDPDDRYSTGAKVGGTPVYDWHFVKPEIFKEYLNFLKTGEKKWLNAAQSHLKS